MNPQNKCKTLDFIESAGIIIQKDLRWLCRHDAHIALANNFLGDLDGLLDSEESKWIGKIMSWEPDDRNLSKWSRFKNKIDNADSSGWKSEVHERLQQLATNLIRGIQYLKQRDTKKNNEKETQSLLRKLKKDLQKLGHVVSVDDLEGYLFRSQKITSDLDWLEWIFRDEIRLEYLRDQINTELQKHNLYPEYNALLVKRIAY